MKGPCYSKMAKWGADPELKCPEWLVIYIVRPISYDFNIISNKNDILYKSTDILCLET